MNRRIMCITLIAIFMLSALLTSLAAQTSSPIRITQEIDPGTAPLFTDLKETAIKSAVTPQKRPSPEPKAYALTIEIDYIEGHRPTDTVLEYMTNYFLQQGITLTINLAAEPVPFYESVSDDEFWAIEAAYNKEPDKYTNDLDYSEFIMEYKWVLFGTTVEGSDNTVGYTYCIGTTRDLVAGNFIYIADQTADDWAGSDPNRMMGAEATVLMHEFGHPIGICVVRVGAEAYCSNYYCVMSYLRTQNAGNTGLWYYCSTHWKTKNLDYYLA